MSLTTGQARNLVHQRRRVFDNDRRLVGTLTQIYLVDDTLDPVWAIVELPGSTEVRTPVPIGGVEVEDGDLMLGCLREQVWAAPPTSADDDFPWRPSVRLCEHYGRRAPAEGDEVLVPVTDLGWRTPNASDQSGS